MMCQNCNKNPATVILRRNINGHESEYHLCNKCAEQVKNEISFEKLFQGFLDAFLSCEQQSDLLQKSTTQTALKCSKCGFTYDDFKKTGKLGCNECYRTFRGELLSVLENMQGSTKHNGKVPKKICLSPDEKKLITLKLKLKKAIKYEEYEQAADIRDEIKVLEKKIKEVKGDSDE